MSPALSKSERVPSETDFDPQAEEQARIAITAHVGRLLDLPMSFEPVGDNPILTIPKTPAAIQILFLDEGVVDGVFGSPLLIVDVTCRLDLGNGDDLETVEAFCRYGRELKSGIESIKCGSEWKVNTLSIGIPVIKAWSTERQNALQLSLGLTADWDFLHDVGELKRAAGDVCPQLVEVIRSVTEKSRFRVESDEGLESLRVPDQKVAGVKRRS